MHAVFERMQQNFSPKLLPNLTFEELQTLLLKLYKPKQNFHTMRFVFHRTVQQQGQTFTEYITHTKKLANTNNFGDYLSEALIDQINFGILENNLRKRLLAIDLDLEKAISTATQHACIEKDSYLFSHKLREGSIQHSDINNVIARKGFSSNQSSSKSLIMIRLSTANSVYAIIK